MNREDLLKQLDIFLSLSISFATLNEEEKVLFKAKLYSLDDVQIQKVIEVYQKEQEQNQAMDKEFEKESSILNTNIREATQNIKKTTLKENEKNAETDSQTNLNKILEELGEE